MNVLDYISKNENLKKYFEKIILEEIINNLKFYSDEKEDINLYNTVLK